MKRLLQILALAACVAALPLAAAAQDNQTNNNQKQWGKAPQNTTQTTQQNGTRTWGRRVEPRTTVPARRPHPTTAHDVRHDSTTPPGWEHGRKVGWRGDDRPPGLAKKDADYHHHYRRHHRGDFDRDHDRRFRERREREHFRHDRDHDRDRH